MGNWEKVKITNLANYINGYAFKPIHWHNEGLPIIRIEQLKNPDSKYDYCNHHIPSYNHIYPGDLIFSWSASIFLKIWDRGNAVLNQHLFKVIPNEKVEKIFLKYLIEYNLFELMKNAHGSTMQHITRKELAKFEIYFPTSLTEQSRIAAILSTADEAIANTEALIAKYQSIKTGLMQDLLTCGIDEKGNIRSKRTHKFVKKNGIEVPVEWDVVRLENVCIRIQDGTHFSPKSKDGEFRYITSKNIRFGYMDLENCNWISKKEHDSIYLRCSVKYGDVLLTKDGANTGNATINTLNEEFSLLSSVAMIRCDERKILNEYLLQYLLSKNFQKEIKDMMSGNAITRITLQKIQNFQII